MTATPVPPADGTEGSEPRGPAATLTAWLRGRTDRQLARLLQLRPDLALPAPADIAALASRVAVRTSTQRCVDTLDAFTLRALENLVLAAGGDDTVTDPAPDGLDELLERALVWGDGELVHLVPSVREAVGTYPAGLGRRAAALYPLVPDVQLAPVLRRLGLPPAAQPRAGASVAALVDDPDWLATQLDALDAEERDILGRLAAGPPVGSVRDTRLTPDEAEWSAPLRLVARGLLVALDAQRVELPREIGRALRARRDPPTTAAAPDIALVERDPTELDRLGTTAVLETLRLVDALAGTWTAQPPATLRSGGLGVRDLKRTARDLGVEEATAAVLVEVAYAAGLVNATSGPQPAFLPSTDYDVWHGRGTSARWTALATAWLTMTRQPSLVNQRGDRDRVISALSPDVERGTLPALRRQALSRLAELPPGAAPADRADVLARLAWEQPRRAAAQRPLVESVLAEADLLGVTAAGGLTGYSRTLLAGPAGSTAITGSVAAAEHALDHALPEPVGHFLVQPDLTVVVPGPPERGVAAELGALADLESTGGANVYRITESTVRRALDTGRTGERLLAFVRERSRTPIPQALEYLVEDAARRHGVLRAGAAGCYLRCDDEALLARVVGERGTGAVDLRLIAPTVAISDASVSRVLEVLRGAGFAPAAEAADGQLITLGVDPPRAPSRPPARAIVSRSAPDAEAQSVELVRRLRSGDALAGQDHRVHPVAQQVPGVTSASTMELLRRAVREAKLVWLGCAEADGRTTAHVVQPISLAAGTVRGYERDRPGLAAYPVHRITAIRILDDERDDADPRPGQDTLPDPASGSDLP